MELGVGVSATAEQDDAHWSPKKGSKEPDWQQARRIK